MVTEVEFQGYTVKVKAKKVTSYGAEGLRFSFYEDDEEVEVFLDEEDMDELKDLATEALYEAQYEL